MIKYIYIDDEEPMAVESFVAGLNDTKLIEVECLKLSNTDNIEGVIRKTVDGIKNGANGIIFDLCLNGDGPNRISTTASPIAQEIRSLASSGSICHVPIVLCSTNENINGVFEPDKASHDLYEYKFCKTSVDFIQSAQILRSLAVGYLKILSGVPITEILARDNLERIDERVFDRFYDTEQSPLDWSHFLINEIFDHAGVLISKDIMAARLGVDINASSDSWEALLASFGNEIMYRGVFYDGWTRFWSDLLSDQFERLTGYLYQALSATERVDKLNAALGLTLKPATALEFCTSTFFDTICEGTRAPIDSIEAYEIAENLPLSPWQMPKYLSFYALTSGKFPNIKIKKREEARFINDREALLNEQD